jgi:hypothetical protein
MLTRTLGAAAVAALVLAPAAFAATMTPDQTCSTLQAQFDSAIGQKSTAQKATDAKALRAEGGKLCASGQAKAGINYINSALKMIGEKPKA